jgi:hypothetical protein
MAHFPQVHSAQRAPRVRVTRRVQITININNGKAINGLLATISRTGGLALLQKKLPPGALVEINFRTTSGLVTSIAEMLDGQEANEGVLQAFKHIALSDEDHINLVHGMSTLGN